MDSLKTELHVKNVDRVEWSFTALLHTYFKVVSLLKVLNFIKNIHAGYP